MLHDVSRRLVLDCVWNALKLTKFVKINCFHLHSNHYASGTSYLCEPSNEQVSDPLPSSISVDKTCKSFVALLLWFPRRCHHHRHRCFFRKDFKLSENAFGGKSRIWRKHRVWLKIFEKWIILLGPPTVPYTAKAYDQWRPPKVGIYILTWWSIGWRHHIFWQLRSTLTSPDDFSILSWQELSMVAEFIREILLVKVLDK